MCDICVLEKEKFSKLWRDQTYLIWNYFSPHPTPPLFPEPPRGWERRSWFKGCLDLPVSRSNTPLSLQPTPPPTPEPELEPVVDDTKSVRKSEKSYKWDILHWRRELQIIKIFHKTSFVRLQCFTNPTRRSVAASRKSSRSARPFTVGQAIAPTTAEVPIEAPGEDMEEEGKKKKKKGEKGDKVDKADKPEKADKADKPKKAKKEKPDKDLGEPNEAPEGEAAEEKPKKKKKKDKEEAGLGENQDEVRS